MMQNIVHQPKFLIVQIVTDQTCQLQLSADILETEQLIATYGGCVAGQLVQRRDHPDLSYFIGAGKVEELKQICADRQIDVVVLNAMAKSGQIFRLEKALWEISPRIMVWDRIDLILNIFDQHATTVESKLQIKLARAKHMGPRIYGLGKTELSRQGGGIGTRGKGETNIEFERRKIKVDQQKIQKELRKLLQQKHARLKIEKKWGLVQ